jgi:hypothetical protein
MNRLRPLEHWDRGFESHPRHGCLFILRVGSGLATGWSPVQGVLPTVHRLRNWKSGQGPQGLWSTDRQINITDVPQWYIRTRYGFSGSDYMQVTRMINNSVQESNSTESDSHSTRDFPSNLKAHYRIHSRPTNGYNPSNIIPVHSRTYDSFKIHFNITFPSMPRSLKWSQAFKLSD